MSEYDWMKFRQAVGKNVEDVGRMLRREKPFTKEDLTHLRDTLNYAAESVQIFRDATFK